MTIAEHLSVPVEIEIDGRRWRLLFTHAVLLAIERMAGLQVLASGIDFGSPSAKLFAASLWALLERAGASYSPEAAARLVTPRNALQIHRALLDAWNASMPEPGEIGEGPCPTWLEAWAIARRTLRLSNQEWLDLTPRLLAALTREHLEQVRQGEFLLSRLTAVTANFGFRAPERAFREDRFMLHPWPEQEKKPLTGEDLMRFFAGFPKTPESQKWKQ